jgi:hypothetical protein
LCAVCDTSQLEHDKPTKILHDKCVLVLAEHIPSSINEDGNGAHTILGTEILKKFDTAHRIKNNDSPYT